MIDRGVERLSTGRMAHAVTDLELLEAWAEGDTHAANQLLDRYFEGLCRFFRTKTSGDVAELLQQTLRLAVQNRRRCRNGSTVRAHLYRTARHLLFAYEGSRDLALSTDPQADTRDDHGRKTGLPLDDPQALRAALRKLPLDHQIALELHYWEQLDAMELAQVLRVPEPGVGDHLERGREMLRRQLGEPAAPSGLTSQIRRLAVIDSAPSDSTSPDGEPR